MRKFNSLLLAIVIAISSIFAINITENAKPVLASGTTQNYKKIDYYTSGKVKGVTYYFEESGNQVKKHNGLHDTETSTYNIYSQKNGKSKLLVKDVENNCITNGTYLYYVKYKNYKANVYRMTLKTKKSKKLFTAPKKDSYYECKVFQVKGNYLYFISAYDDGDFSYRTYVHNTKTKKNKKLGNRINVSIWGKQLIIQEGGTELTNMNIYFAKLNGTKKKKIVSGATYFVYKNKFYWLEEKFEGSNYQYRLGCCNKNGKNKKYVSTWKSGLDQNTDIPNFSSTNEEKKKLIDRMK